MVEITALAAEKLSAYLSENKIDSPVRIAAMNGCGGPSLGLALDEQKDSDHAHKNETFTLLIELRLRKAGLDMTAKAAMQHMNSLHSCLLWLPGKRKAMRMLEDPNEDQSEIMRAFGWKIDGGALQEI